MLKIQIKKLIKEIIFRTPLRKNFFPLYDFNFTAPQLCFLCQCVEDTRHLPGSIVEIGCAGGLTTVFLNNYQDSQDIQKDYYAIDTFSGFTAKDVNFEVSNRGKQSEMYSSFRVNKKKWFDGTMNQNNIHRVRSVQADINEYDLAPLGPVSFGLLDVDLYRPMKKCLKEIYEALTPGGMIAVDDCDPNDIRWDGSDQAYKEFMKEIDQPAVIVHGKLGVIKKPV